MAFSEKISSLGENQAEPKDIETVVWRAVATGRRTTVPRTIVKATITTHTARPTNCTSRICLR